MFINFYEIFFLQMQSMRKFAKNLSTAKISIFTVGKEYIRNLQIIIMIPKYTEYTLLMFITWNASNSVQTTSPWSSPVNSFIPFRLHFEQVTRALCNPCTTNS